MPKENEELDPEEVSEETLPEESSEEGEIENKDQVPSEEDTKEEYTKERFDGMMSSWQKDRRDLLDLQADKEKQSQPKNQEDVWVDYLFNKIEAKRKTKDAEEDVAAKRELEEVKVAYPGLESDNILNTAIKYKTDLRTAANILEDIKSSQESGRSLTEGEIARKRKASSIAGKPGASSKPGLTPYDKNLSLEDNILKGKEELG